VFIGALPQGCLEQAARVFPFDRFEEVRVCCSGSFRFEQTIAQLGSGARIIGNDVSLVTVCIGTLAATGQCPTIEFVGELAPLEAILKGASAYTRVAALLVAAQIGRFTGPSEHAALHRQHFLQHLTAYLPRAEEKLGKLLSGLRLDGFFAGDFREHARLAAGRNAAVVGAPPTYKGGYERLYKFLNQNVRWDAPTYGVFDPKETEEWILELERADTPYCVFADQLFSRMTPVAAHTTESRKALYLYAKTRTSSLRRREPSLKRFFYEAVQPDALGRETTVEIVPVGSGEMNFLKEIYLAKGIAHTPGQLNFLVYLGRKLAGGFIYTRSQNDPTTTLYLLSDFALSRERRLSKLIAMMATCSLPVGIAERKLLISVERVLTTAFTDKPVSMKYRGAFDLIKRGEGFLNYASPVRRAAPQEIYREWWDRHAKHPNHARTPAGAQAP
jgi:hypothetical protein